MSPTFSRRNNSWIHLRRTERRVSDLDLMQNRSTPVSDSAPEAPSSNNPLGDEAAILESAGLNAGPGFGPCACGRGGTCCGGAACLSGGTSARFISPFKVTMALGLATLVGSFMVLKPEPQGVLASDTTRLTQITPEQLRQIGRGAGTLQAAQTATGQMQTDEWRSLGTLESDGMLIRIETRENRLGEAILAYTAIDRTGNELATRVTIEDLRSQFPRLDWDSLTAATPGRLMIASDQDQP